MALDPILVKPRDLPALENVTPTDFLVVDNGATVGSANPVQVVDAGAPVASPAEAIAGTDNTKRVTPLALAAALENDAYPFVSLSQAWAESPTPPDPFDPDSKSSKTWSGVARDAADALATAIFGGSITFTPTSLAPITLPSAAWIITDLYASGLAQFSPDDWEQVGNQLTLKRSSFIGQRVDYRYRVAETSTLTSVNLEDGSNAFPSLSFTLDPDLGLYRIGANILGFSAGGSERMRLTTSGAQITGLLTGTAVTQSTTDTTPGRVMTVGYGGLGSVGVTTTDANTISATGTYRAGSTALNIPSSNFFTISHHQFDASNAYQVAYQYGTVTRAFYRQLNNNVWRSWVEVVLDTRITQSATDTTAGRLLKVGDFGLGGNAIPLTGAGLLKDRLLETGAYAYNGGADIPDGPEGTVSWTRTLSVIRLPSSIGGGGVDRRVFIDTRANVTGSQRMWFGANSGNGAIIWREIYQQGSILGTVSQSGGVPTGALFEAGSNANGTYLRLPDGTQICTKRLTGLGPVSTTLGSGFSSGPLPIGSWAAAFAASPEISLQGRGVDSHVFCSSVTPPTTTAGGSFVLLRFTTSAATTFDTYVIAVGHWF